ncbi:hypothetical protein KJJ67_004473, partial [Salmonella enterica]|nr:hypothetical protein [Salmonella enterica]
VAASMNGAELEGAQTTVTVTQAQPQFILTANTHKNPYAFGAGSGFPTTGFAGATFTVTGLPRGTTATDYTWTTQASGGGSAGWLGVDQAGVVTFKSRPSSAEKRVEIIATPKAGGQPLGYQFTLDSWFINNGNVAMVWSDASAYCTSQSGYGLATVQQLNGSTTHSDGRRGVIAGLWSEWGNFLTYTGAGFYGKYFYWSSEQESSGWHYNLYPNVGVVFANTDRYTNYVVCRQGL